MSHLSVQVESGDQLPPYCVVCGAEATDSCMISCRALIDRADRVANAASWGAFIMGLFSGMWVYFQTPKQIRSENWWLTLPTCRRHATSVEVQSVIDVVPVTHRSARLNGCSDAFRREVEKMQSDRPKSNVAAMAQYDTAAQDADGFLGDLTKESLPDEKDFLRGLEEGERR